MPDWKHEHDCELSLRREWSARAQKAEQLLREVRQYAATLLTEIDAAPMDIVERLRWSISADTPARYPDIVNDAISEIERSRTALQTSLVAMRIASRLPGVSDEYDFEPAIAEVAAVMSGTKVKAREQN